MMKPQATFSCCQSYKPWLLAFSLLLVLGICFAQYAYGAEAEEIDASANAALKRFYRKVQGARELGTKASGLLILPNVKKAAFVFGGEYGEGALRIEGKTVGYYNLISGSLGFQIGAEIKDIVIAFMTQEALDTFRASYGWEVGVDGNVALIVIGAGERVDFTTIQDPIVAFIFDVKGLMVDISLKGAKFTRLNK